MKIQLTTAEVSKIVSAHLKEKGILPEDHDGKYWILQVRQHLVNDPIETQDILEYRFTRKDL